MFSYGFTSNNCVFSFPLKLSLPLICVDPHLSLKGGDLHYKKPTLEKSSVGFFMHQVGVRKTCDQ